MRRSRARWKDQVDKDMKRRMLETKKGGGGLFVRLSTILGANCDGRNKENKYING